MISTSKFAHAGIIAVSLITGVAVFFGAQQTIDSQQLAAIAAPASVKTIRVKVVDRENRPIPNPAARVTAVLLYPDKRPSPVPDPSKYVTIGYSTGSAAGIIDIPVDSEVYRVINIQVGHEKYDLPVARVVNVLPTSPSIINVPVQLVRTEGTVLVTVIDEKTNAPIKDAAVKLESTLTHQGYEKTDFFDLKTGTTGSNGKANISIHYSHKEEKYRVSVSAAGYETSQPQVLTFSGVLAEATVKLKPSQSKSQVTVSTVDGKGKLLSTMYGVYFYGSGGDISVSNKSIGGGVVSLKDGSQVIVSQSSHAVNNLVPPLQASFSGLTPGQKYTFFVLWKERNPKTGKVGSDIFTSKVNFTATDSDVPGKAFISLPQYPDLEWVPFEAATIKNAQPAPAQHLSQPPATISTGNSPNPGNPGSSDGSGGSSSSGNYILKVTSVNTATNKTGVYEHTIKITNYDAATGRFTGTGTVVSGGQIIFETITGTWKNSVMGFALRYDAPYTYSFIASQGTYSNGAFRGTALDNNSANSKISLTWELKQVNQ